jgi:eukaryotic-like serine/threonine-protein kinase
MDDGKSSRESNEAELAERVGTLINERYRVLRVIGHGSTGAVYACQHVGLDKLVALKVLHREMEQNASFVDRFKLEAQAASRLEHPNSVRVLDFGQDQGTGALFIAMEYIEGRDLLQVLEEDGPFSAERAVDVMSQILDVLGVAHAAGIVHRDLKPENILLRAVEIDGVTREHVTVCDFGIAQFGGRRPAADGSSGSSGSPDGEDGLVAGTPAYMSPEQARAEPQDARSDVYSAGVVLYQLLTLQLPFYSDDAYALALKHCVEVPPPPSRFGAVSPQLEEICLKALSKSRDARYQSAREMRQSLQRVLSTDPALMLDGGKPRRWGLPRTLAPHGTPSDAPAVEMLPAPTRSSHSSAMLGRLWRYSLGGAVVVGCVLFAGVLFTHNQDQRASAAGPSSSRTVSMVRPSRVQQTAGANRAAAGSQRAAAGSSSSVVQPARSETAYSAASSAGEIPETHASLPTGTLEGAAGSASDTAANLSALAEVESLVGSEPVDSSRRSPGAAGSGSNASSSKLARAHGEPSRPERKGHETAQPGRVTLPAAAEKPLFAQRADNKAVADKVVADKPASDARPAHPEPSDTHARPQSHLDSLDFGILPDVPIDVEAAAVGAAPAPEPPPTAAEPAHKPVLVKAVAESKEEREPASRPAPPASGNAAQASAAHVSITKIASRSGVSKSSVRSALNLTAITDCYRSALQGGGVSSQRVNGELELATSQSGSVTEASLNAPDLPTPLRHCVEQIVRRGRVREADTGNAQATISLAFQPR